jgi:Predicted transcriptional regulators
MPKKEVPPFIQKLRQVFSHNLEVCRKNKGYTQDKISELVGISQAFYSQVERGNNLVGLPVLMKLANILDVSANALLYEHKEALMNEDKIDLSDIIMMLSDRTEDEIALVKRVVRFVLTEIDNQKIIEKVEL